MTDLSDLLVRLREGGDAHLHRDIYLALLGPETDGMTASPYALAPRILRSVDAALGLVERVIPGAPVRMTWWGTDGRSPPDGTACIVDGPDQDAASLPLAILAALLTSLENGK